MIAICPIRERPGNSLSLVIIGSYGIGAALFAWRGGSQSSIPSRASSILLLLHRDSSRCLASVSFFSRSAPSRDPARHLLTISLVGLAELFIKRRFLVGEDE